MRSRYENWVEGLNGDWCVSRQRFFGVPFPVWYPLDTDGRSATTSAIVAARGPAAGRSIDGPAARIPGRPARSAGRLHAAIPTSWTRGPPRRSRRRSRAAGRTIRISSRASSRWTCGRRRTTSSAPGCSTRWRARTSSTTRCRGRTRRSPAGSRSRSQEDVEVEGQRGHADGAARGARLRRRALLGGERTAGHRHGVRSRTDEGRPAAGNQAAERVEVRAGARASRAGQSRRPSTAAC